MAGPVAGRPVMVVGSERLDFTVFDADHAIDLRFDAAGALHELVYCGAPESAAGGLLAQSCVLISGWLRLGMPAVEIGRAFVTNQAEDGPLSRLMAQAVAAERENVRRLKRPRRGDPRRLVQPARG